MNVELCVHSCYADHLCSFPFPSPCVGSYGRISFWEACDLVIVPPEDATGTCFSLPILLPWRSVSVPRFIQLNVAAIPVIFLVFGVAAAILRTRKRALTAAKQPASERVQS